MSTRHRFETEMLVWINARLAPPGVHVTSETALFTSGVINSIRILELIAFTERGIGRAIPDAFIKLDNFHSVARISSVFVSEEADDAAA